MGIVNSVRADKQKVWSQVTHVCLRKRSKTVRVFFPVEQQSDHDPASCKLYGDKPLHAYSQETTSSGSNVSQSNRSEIGKNDAPVIIHTAKEHFQKRIPLPTFLLSGIEADRIKRPKIPNLTKTKKNIS